MNPAFQKPFKGPDTNGSFRMEGSRGPQKNSESVVIIF